MVDSIFYVIENLYQHYHYVCLLGNGKFVLSDRKLDHCRINKETYTMVNLYDTCSALATYITMHVVPRNMYLSLSINSETIA